MHAERPATLAEAIRAVRREFGSHEKLARAVGTTRNTVIEWEKGRSPRPNWWPALIEAGVPEGLLVEAPSESVGDQLASIVLRLEALEGKVAELPTAADMKRLGDAMRREIARANQATAAGQRAK